VHRSPSSSSLWYLSFFSESTGRMTTINTSHEDMIHDAQMDYYGRRLATCSSDRTIKIFEVSNETTTQTAEIKGHEGPVWQVAWAHPKFGAVLASCSYDRKVMIWKETSQNVWTKIYEYSHDLSVNSIAWGPEDFGLLLASASSDCSITILTYRDDNWESKKITEAHSIGVNSVSWASANSSLIGEKSNTVKRLVSGGCDNTVKIWRFNEGTNDWKLEETLEGHSDWVRDVAWAPNIGLPTNTIASCSQDGTVIIWTQEASSPWAKKVLSKFTDVVWRVSWSITGNILAVSGGDNKVTLWKESSEAEWKCITSMEGEN